MISSRGTTSRPAVPIRTYFHRRYIFWSENRPWGSGQALLDEVGPDGGVTLPLPQFGRLMPTQTAANIGV